MRHYFRLFLSTPSAVNFSAVRFCSAIRADYAAEIPNPTIFQRNHNSRGAASIQSRPPRERRTSENTKLYSEKYTRCVSHVPVFTLRSAGSATEIRWGKKLGGNVRLDVGLPALLGQLSFLFLLLGLKTLFLKSRTMIIRRTFQASRTRFFSSRSWRI